ncbi:MAG: FHA domain-containing protein [Tissierellales bacterium]
MTNYVKVCEICGHENNVSYLECEDCSADISYVSPTQEIEEEKDESSIVPDKSRDDEESANEFQSNNTVLVGRIKLVAAKDNFEVHVPVKLETVLGREGDLCNDYFDQSNFISRRHSTIRLISDGYSITDHSSNGTFVNGKLLKRGQSAKIKAGDIVTLADIEFLIENL